MVVTAVAKLWRIYMKKTSTLKSQTSDNTNPSEKDLPSIKKKAITNALKPKAIKPNYFLKAKKPIVKVTPSEPIEAVRVIAKTVHLENNVVVKVPSLKN